MREINNSSRRIQILALLTIVAVVFANSLFNHFVGDDEALFLKNTFYHSIANVRFFFSKHYIANPAEYFGNEDYFNSGSVAYRPVVSLSYLFDYSVWGTNPFGYHLTNYLLHLTNCLLVYFLVGRLTAQNQLAFFAALLFGIHPTKAEAVCAIGYRQDLLAAFFILLAILKHVTYSIKGISRKWFWPILFYFLAVFTKESAVVMPVMVFLYDRFFHQEQSGKKVYISYAVVLVFYLFVYLFIFPNLSLVQHQFFNVFSFKYLYAIISLLALNTLQLVWPFALQPLPPLYLPAEAARVGIFSVVAVTIDAFLIGLTVRFFKQQRIGSLFLLWFLIFYIPISNLVPLANPFTHRFLYLPSIGLLTALAIGLMKGYKFFAEKKKQVLFCAIVGILSFFICLETVRLNMLWRSNVSLALNWVKYFPSEQKGFAIMAIEAHKALGCPTALPYLKKTLEFEPQDPRMHYMLGTCLDNIMESKARFQRAIDLNPNYRAPYIGMGKTFYAEGRYNDALNYFVIAHGQKRTFETYRLLMLTYQRLKNKNKLLDVLSQARTDLHVPAQLQVLEEIANQDLKSHEDAP